MEEEIILEDRPVEGILPKLTIEDILLPNNSTAYSMSSIVYLNMIVSRLALGIYNITGNRAASSPTDDSSIEYKIQITMDDKYVTQTTGDRTTLLWVTEKWKNRFLHSLDYMERVDEAALLSSNEIIGAVEEFLKVGEWVLTKEFKLFEDKDLYVISTTTDLVLVVNKDTRDRLMSYSPADLPTISVNSESLTVDEITSRFNGAIWYEKIQQKSITLAGVGGIGSYVGFLLSRLKPYHIWLYDPDIVETVNLSGQLYSKSNIGDTKVGSLAQMMRSYSSFNNVSALAERFDDVSDPTNIMICGFDNMEARRTFYNVWKKQVYSLPSDHRKSCLFIDGRLAAEEFQVIAIQGDDIRAMETYEDKWLFSDEEADPTVCSYKQTTFMANMIASVMVNIFVNFVANECNPIIDRDVPFITSYSAETMFFNVEM